MWKRLYLEALAYAPRPLKARPAMPRWTSNAVLHVPDGAGGARRFARFAVSDWYMAVDGIGDGIVYALKRDGFEKDPWSEQWASTRPTTTLFGVPMTPADFPCMGHGRGQTVHEFRQDARSSDTVINLLKSTTAVEHTGRTTRISVDTVGLTPGKMNDVVAFIRDQLPEECKVTLDGSGRSVVVTVEGPEWVSALLRGFLSMRI
jgi:hypothetical protein